MIDRWLWHIVSPLPYLGRGCTVWEARFCHGVVNGRGGGRRTYCGGGEECFKEVVRAELQGVVQFGLDGDGFDVSCG